MLNILVFFIAISSLWFIRQAKVILFWLYLWQLKEYHIGRFLDHFRTYKGKKIFLNRLYLSKIGLLFYALILYYYSGLLPWYFYSVWIFILIVIYFFESIKFISNIAKKAIKKPILTQKTIILVLANFIFTFFFVFFLLQKVNFLYWFSFWLLSFDILSPFLISGIILLFQPITVLLRNKLIKRAKEKREKFKNLIVVGIAGSYGKTSTKEFLASILSNKFNVLKTKEHQNSEVGIAQCILNDLTSEHEIFVCEIGAYNKGKIKEVCGFIRPKIGILTGINEQHMATFGSQENIIEAKYELIETLPEDGTAFFNDKNKYCVELYEKTKIKKFLYGKEAKFFGEENILGAMAVAKELGLTDREISQARAKIKNQFSGIEAKQGINGINIINATYSANPDGVMAHLAYLKSFSGKKVIIMPCLIELGKASKEVHRRIGKKIAEACDLAIITTKDRFKDIKDEAGGKAVFSENPKQIFERLKSFCQPGDIILLESRVPQELINLLNA